MNAADRASFRSRCSGQAFDPIADLGALIAVDLLMQEFAWMRFGLSSGKLAHSAVWLRRYAPGFVRSAKGHL